MFRAGGGRRVEPLRRTDKCCYRTDRGVGEVPLLGSMSQHLAVLFLCLGAAASQEQKLNVGQLHSAFVNEDSFQYYAVQILPGSEAIKVKLVPSYGDPDVYLSFRSAEPDDLTATWVMDDVGAEEQVLKRDAVEFCQGDPCVLHISVYGYDESEYMIGVYEAEKEKGSVKDECSPGCKQDFIADGVCQQVRAPGAPDACLGRD